MARAEPEPTTHFGYETVPEAEKAGRVHGVFASVAARYDLMNDAMSLGVHRLWKDAMLDWLAPRPGMRAPRRRRRHRRHRLPLPASGSTADGHATVLDMTEDMLAEGRRRAEATDFAGGDRLGRRRRDGAALRRRELRRLHHLLRHPERHPHRGRARRGVPRAAARRPAPRARVLPRARAERCAGSTTATPSTSSRALGQALAGDRASYQYLVESIRRFPDQESLRRA